MSGELTCSSRFRRSLAIFRCAGMSMSTPPRVFSRPMKMFSAMVMFGNRLSSWNTMPMPAARAAAVVGSEIGLPSRITSPVVGCSTPAMIFISVDLPAPFSPTSTFTAPRRTSKSTPFSACVPG